MPYFVFRITDESASRGRSLELLDSFDAFREAKNHARSLRTEQPADVTIKVIFAESDELAEQQLTQQRPEPIMREWEK